MCSNFFILCSNLCSVIRVAEVGHGEGGCYNPETASWPGGSFLGVGGDLNGQLHRLLQGVAGALVHRLHRLDVNAGDDQAVLREPEVLAHLVVGVEPKHWAADDLGRVLHTIRPATVYEYKCRSGSRAQILWVAHCKNEWDLTNLVQWDLAAMVQEWLAIIVC